MFEAFCENIVHAGPPGHGHTLKLINNFIAQAICTATAEACAAAAKSGVSLRKLYDVVSVGGANSPLFRSMMGPMLDNGGDLTGVMFELDNARKDIRYYTHFAESLPVCAIVGEAVHQSLVNASLQGFGGKYVAVADRGAGEALQRGDRSARPVSAGVDLPKERA